MELDDPELLRARHSDPSTSHEAMAAFGKERMEAASRLVVRIFRELGPMADFQFRPEFEAAWAQRCDDSLHRQARRTARDRGHIRDSGVRIVHPATNRRQIVWEWCQDAPPVVTCCPTCGSLIREGLAKRQERLRRKRMNGKQRPLLLSQEALPEPPVSWS